MPRIRPLFAAATLALVSPAVASAQDTPRESDNAKELDPIKVTGQRPKTDQYTVEPDPGSQSATDAAQLMRQVPGGAVNTNGGLSGQAQYRGAFGPRVNVQVDGLAINPGGPNWMDPPSHYAPANRLQSLESARGIAPVTVAGESIGGAVRLNTRDGEFGKSDAFQLDGRLSLQGATVNDGLGGGGNLTWADNRQRFQIAGSFDQADDTEFHGGTIAASEYERSSYSLAYDLKLGDHRIGLEYRHVNTDESGTPAFPMDILFVDTDIYRVDYDGSFGHYELDGELFYTSVDHGMSNFELRSAPEFNPMMSGPDRRRVPASSHGFGWALSAARPLGTGRLEIGVDGLLATNNTTVFDPDNPDFFAVPFNDNERDRYSLFGQWQGPVAARTELELGLRWNHFETDAGDGAVAAGLPGPAQRITAAFNAADRSRSDDNIDAVAKLDYRVNDALTLIGGIGRKTRSPSYIERYAYIPLEATAGLADGNNHVGDIGLEPEVAYEMNLGFDWRDGSFSVTPRVFYRRVNDYITGVPVDDTPGMLDKDVEKVSNLNGDPTPLRYANVDAELYGFDAGWRWLLSPQLSADGTLRYVRGKRRDSDDDLYRIAPPSARAALNYRAGDWRWRLESVFVANQSHISETHFDAAKTADPRTDGYALLNLSGTYSFGARTDITLGVNNLFDRFYRDHLGGFNRVIGSDVGLGERLPGAGRSLFVQVSHRL